MKLTSSFAASDSPKPAVRRKILSSDQIHPCTTTPQKPEAAPRRVRNRREIAKGLQKSSREEGNDAKDVESFAPVDAEKPKTAKADCELPEKYQILAEFFDSLVSSIRLLQLKRTPTTFSKLSRSIESLTDRRFTYGHLAQIKYILQEELDIKKILVSDEKTSCMKPELDIKLQIASLGKGKKDKSSSYLHLKKEFRSRLLNFCRAHPEGDEVPEECLPDPFNPNKPCIIHNMEKPVQSSSQPSPSDVPPPEPSMTASHLPQSFRRKFLPKPSNQQSENSQLDLLMTPRKPEELVNSQPCSTVMHSPISQISRKPEELVNSQPCSTVMHSPISQISKRPSRNQKSLNFGEIVNEPKTDGEDSVQEFDPVKGTPPGHISTPLRLMTRTPEVMAAKRRRLGLEDSPVQPRLRNHRKSLNFPSPAKNTSADGEKAEKGCSSADENSLKFLPDALLQSIREKEWNAMEERDLGFAEARKRKQMIAKMPKLFDMIHLIFQSAKRSVITKSELMHKIIWHSVDITDKEEVEEQLKLLQELVPDWISEKVIPTGNIVYRISNTLGPEAIHARLAEAE